MVWVVQAVERKRCEIDLEPHDQDTRKYDIIVLYSKYGTIQTAHVQYMRVGAGGCGCGCTVVRKWAANARRRPKQDRACKAIRATSCSSLESAERLE